MVGAGVLLRRPLARVGWRRVFTGASGARAWTHLLAIVSGNDIDPATPIPAAWLTRAAAARPEIPLPIDMSDGTPHRVPYPPWDGEFEQAVDGAIQDARTTIYPLHGLDPYDPRD